MAKTVTVPVPVNINSVQYPVGTYIVNNDPVSVAIVQVVAAYNDGQAYITRKNRGNFTDATAV